MSANKNNQQKKTTLRVLGITLLIIGVILLIRGITSFMPMFYDYSYMPMMMRPQRIGSIMLGMPCIFLGIIFTALGFMGDVTSYHPQDNAPVQKNTSNYKTEGTKDSIEKVTKSVKENIKEEPKDEKITCKRCLGKISKNAKFCEHCGEKVENDKVCLNCQTKNNKDAHYCRNCGIRL